MPTALFVGGYADGRWIDVPDGHDDQRCAVNEYSESDETYKQHVYRSTSLHSGSDQWRVFIPLEMTGPELMEALLRNYRPVQRRSGESS